MPQAPDERADSARLADAINRAARALEKQNRFNTKFLHGLMIGIGTAIGASLIATLILLVISTVLRRFGIDLMELRQ